MDIHYRIESIKNRIAKASGSANIAPSDITIVAVTKSVSENTILKAVDAGIYDLAENRVQELCSKHPNIDRDVRWHLVGSLQTNKAKYIIDKVHLIHSLDRLSLAEEIEIRAQKTGRIVPVLVQVNVSREVTKHGLHEDELLAFIERAGKYHHLRIKGLMTIAPHLEDAQGTRPYYARLRELFEAVKKAAFPCVDMKYLSMGMSDDFEAAIQEGSNMVRIGRAIFGDENLRR